MVALVKLGQKMGSKETTGRRGPFRTTTVSRPSFKGRREARPEGKGPSAGASRRWEPTDIATPGLRQSPSAVAPLQGARVRPLRKHRGSRGFPSRSDRSCREGGKESGKEGGVNGPVARGVTET